MTHADPPPTADAAARRSLGARVRGGTFASLAGQLGAQGLRLAGNLILARLLFPEAFGLMAIVWLVVNALNMLSDVGVRPSVVRDERGDDPRFLRTAWTIQAARGALLWLAASALALPLASFYGEPQLAGLVPVAALTSLIGGFESTRLLTLGRHLVLGRVVTIELLGQLVGLLGTVGWVLVDPSVWALVVGGLSARITRVALSHGILPGARDRFGWDRDAAQRIISFGKWVLVSTTITFLATRLDILVLGKLLSMSALGVYSIGTLIAQVPNTVSSRLSRAVLLPLLSASHREGRQVLEQRFVQARSLCVPAGILAVVGVVSVAPAFIEYLYDPRYRDAGWIAQLSMLPLWFAFLQFVARSALEAVGNSRALAVGNAVKLAATAAGCLVGFTVAELPGLIVGVGVGALCGYGTIAAFLSAEGMPTLRGDLLYTAITLGLGLAVGIAPHFWVAPERVAVVTLVVGLPVVAAIGATTALRLRTRPA